MNYGFVIDNRSCIGCHACSTACKAENEVPLGVHRTWVKSVETGAWPNARRHFQVTRCNHCANPPCVRICPVTAMFERSDGIVDFDPEECIGCKACMQACPYDAIYIDPDSGTAAKCHYCAHRTDLGLAPACVVVCPTEAIVAGDLDDPDSRIGRLVARETVSVRKPEQGTLPKLFYIDGHEAALSPALGQSSGPYAWSDGNDDRGAAHAPDRSATRAWTGDETQGAPRHDRPMLMGEGRIAASLMQTTYDVEHDVPWHWPVPAYLVTKGVAAGSAMLLAVMLGLGAPLPNTTVIATTLLTSLAFTAVTTALLVLDLDRPERFLRILTRPQWRSWLTRGAYVLVAFSAVTAIWFLVELLGPGAAESVRGGLLMTTSVLALLVASYTAFLFGQAEGRDLWQSSLLPIHLVVQAVVCGAAGLWLVLGVLLPAAARIIPWFGTLGSETVGWLAGGGYGFLLVALIAGLLVDLGLTLAGELSMPHASRDAARAAHEIRHGRWSGTFWGGSIMMGHVLPIALLGSVAVGALTGAAAPWFVTFSALATLGGQYAYELAFVMAPQQLRNS